MSDNTNKSIDEALNSIDALLNQLNELENSFKQQKERLASDLKSHVQQLAVLSDSQAIRARAIRDLYWKKKLPPTLISDAFGVTIGVMKRIAGPLTVDIPCTDRCGEFIKKSFKHRPELEDFFGSMRRKDISLRCSACQSLRKAKTDERYARIQEEQDRRDEALRNMTWSDFINTEEWISKRNHLLRDSSYACKICRVKGVGLYVYSHKDTPQWDPYDYSNFRHAYYILCSSCTVRCKDLIDEARGEYIKAEFLLAIKEADYQQGP